MSETPPTRDCGGNVAAYALGALDAAEAEAFRRHLEQCSVCRDELAAFEQVVNALPMTAEQYRAPDGLRRRVLAVPEAEPKARRPADERRLSHRGRALWRSRPALALSAVALAVVIVIAAISLSSGAGTTHVYQAQVTGVTGTAEVRVTDGHAVLVVRHFSPPPSGKIYQVWLGRADHPPQPTSALFSVNTNGEGDVDVPGSLKGVNLVMVTPEPVGGSKMPTHAPVVSAKLT